MNNDKQNSRIINFSLVYVLEFIGLNEFIRLSANPSSSPLLPIESGQAGRGERYA
jgi:hypothetical protein